MTVASNPSQLQPHLSLAGFFDKAIQRMSYYERQRSVVPLGDGDEGFALPLPKSDGKTKWLSRRCIVHRYSPL